MHREISHADRAFGEQPTRSSLYLLTAFIGFILLADLWPIVAGWFSIPSWSNTYGGYRIALLAALLGGMRVLYGSLDSLLQGRLGADLALAIACVAAILLGEPLVAAEIVFVGLLGECLENITFARTQAALRQLAELTPRRCWRLRNGQEERVLVSELAVGDVVVVKPGAKVPADGVIKEGRSAVDVSALTGESIPIDKAPGDEILAGSLLATDQGALTIDCQRVAEQTVVGRVIEMTARALQDKAPIERTADRFARYFLPIVLGTAAVTFLVALLAHRIGLVRSDISSLRYAAYPALSVLVVACPCALILATPAAVIAALGRLAGTGILIKGGSALERLAGISAFAFDKTGTLTEGKLQLGEVAPLADIHLDELLRLAASAERGSDHPLARLLVEEAQQRNLTLESADDFVSHPGAGVSATLSSVGRVLVGNVRLLNSQSVAISDNVMSLVTRLDAAGQTVLLVCVYGRILGAIGACDRVRDSAKATIEELRRLGVVHIAMLTGDRAAIARSVAQQVGILEVQAELLPQDKAAFVAAWQEGTPPLRVAMVGDGINDAPALARSTVGLAIGGSGADVAAEAGDVLLTIGPAARDPLANLPFLLRLSRETVRIIRQNIIYFAFALNIAGIVLTAWLWPLLMPTRWHDTGPIAAVIYHQLASLFVLLNSMRLLAFGRESSPTYVALAGRMRRVNDWLDRRLNADNAIHWLSHRWPVVLFVVAGLKLLLFAGSGLYAINPDEVGLVRRFGRVLPDDLTPGLHWRYPWPIEEVTRVQPDRVRSVEIGFRTSTQPSFEPRSWSSRHGTGRLADESVMITGDGNLLEVQGSVRYTVVDSHVYAFGVLEPEKVIRDAAESVLREVVAASDMAELLTVGRETFQDKVTRQLVARLGEQVGVRIEGVSLHDLHPPQEVVEAYHEVTRAMERRDDRINRAEADAIARKREQEARGYELVRRAEATKYERLALAEARKAEFLARYRVRTELSDEDEFWLFSDAATLHALDIPRKKIEVWYAEQRSDRLARQSALVDFRLYWDGLTRALEGRPKMLIDADKLPTRRTLWLVPFEPPVPMPRPRSQREGEP